VKKPWEFDNPLCAEIGPAYFFLEDDGKPYSTNEYRMVKSLCSTCIHQTDCAEWGIAKETFGIWGGLNPRERQSIRRRRRVSLRDSSSIFGSNPL
jgi:hypothetical protein